MSDKKEAIYNVHLKVRLEGSDAPWEDVAEAVADFLRTKRPSGQLLRFRVVSVALDEPEEDDDWNPDER